MALTADLETDLAGSGKETLGELGLKTSPSRLLVDRAAGWTVVGGGLAVISAIFGILLFILVEVGPVFSPAEVSLAPSGTVPMAPCVTLVEDEYRTRIVTLGQDGVLRVVQQGDGAVLTEKNAFDGHLVAARTPPGTTLLTGSSRDGRVVIIPVLWSITFDDDAKREVAAEVGETLVLEVDASAQPIALYAVASEDESAQNLTVAAQLSDGTITVIQQTSNENLFTGEVELATERFVLEGPLVLSALILDNAGQNLYGGNASGELFWWRLSGDRKPQKVASSASPITNLCLLIGGRSLVVGQENGALSVWFPVRAEDETYALTRIRDFPQRDAAVRHIEPSMRDRTFLVLDDGDALGLYSSTSERLLWEGKAPLQQADVVSLSSRADSAILTRGAEFVSLDIANPHPEVSWTALFGKVWYEGYPEPEHVWQSSSGTDDFEAKLGLMPLLIGTLKGTIYALILAIPLAIFGAMYTSQFMDPRVQAYVKPTVEIMAALPSVILGFLAGLWLAPLLEEHFPALLLAFVGLPPLVLSVGSLWGRLPRRLRNRFPMGAEVLLFAVAIAAGIWLCLCLGKPFEALAFGGNFQAWLYETTGLRYDQRNALVIGLAMGFAVIPIIFSIAEEAFTSVPRNLVSGSLALGATRWQTVYRVVLPTASPGVFSGVMVGFGRAVGETMIVLMATGNTPIMDWNPFNGFRTLSANIAVEIPEAPHGGTLYRTLFLAALLLFIVTFLINTVADVIRQNLRKRYAQL